VNTQTSLTDKIQYTLANQISSTFGTYGWQMTSTPTENALLINVPQSTTGTYEQYVMNTITGAWCRFQGWNARCWETWKDQQYFGNATAVCKAFDTYGDGGNSINTDLKTAFNYFGARGQLKQWTMCRPILQADGSNSALYGLNVDFDDSAVTGTPAFIYVPTALWDTAVWDTDIWGGLPAVQKQWQYLAGLGYCAAFRMVTQTNGTQLRFSSIDYVLKHGGVL
jgi:hypothetical protein